MTSFFKKFFSGISFLILGPFWIALFAIFIVYAIIKYLLIFIVGTFRFFSGKTFFFETNLDAEATKDFLKSAEQQNVIQENNVNNSSVHNGPNLSGATINIYNAGKADDLNLGQTLANINPLISNNPVIDNEENDDLQSITQNDEVYQNSLSREHEDN